MKPIILIALVIVFLAIFWPKNIPSPLSLNTNPSPTITPAPLYPLPSGWTLSSQTPNLKFQKESSSAVKPAVVYLSSPLPADTGETIYADKLVKGVRSSLPGIKFERDQTSTQNGIYLRSLKGYYFTQNQKVGFVERLYIVNDTVHSLTASYLYSDNLEDEVNGIFDVISQKKISQ